MFLLYLGLVVPFDDGMPLLCLSWLPYALAAAGYCGDDLYQRFRHGEFRDTRAIAAERPEGLPADASAQDARAALARACVRCASSPGARRPATPPSARRRARRPAACSTRADPGAPRAVPRWPGASRSRAWRRARRWRRRTFMIGRRGRRTRSRATRGPRAMTSCCSATSSQRGATSIRGCKKSWASTATTRTFSW